MEFRSIDIDFDVHKRIELARESFSETPNAVLRRLLGVEPTPTLALEVSSMRGWSGKGVTLPHGTRVRMGYNGRTHEGEILDGLWFVEGERYSSPSAAAGGVGRTKDGRRTNLDGWIYWWVMPPESKAWVKLSEIRKGNSSSSNFKTVDEEEVPRMKLPSGAVSDLPPESEVITALEALLHKVGRPISPSEAYQKLAEEFTLSEEQRSRLMPNGKDCHWENRVRFARRKLVDAGIVARSPRGEWALAK